MCLKEFVVCPQRNDSFTNDLFSADHAIAGNIPCLVPAKECVQCESPAVIRVYDVMSSPTCGLAQGSGSNGGSSPTGGSRLAEGAHTNGNSRAINDFGLNGDSSTVGVPGTDESPGPVESSGRSGGSEITEDAGFVESAEARAGSKHDGGVGLAEDAGICKGSSIADGTGLIGRTGAGEEFEANKSTGFAESATLGKGSELDGGVGIVESSGFGQPSGLKGPFGLVGGSKSNGVLSKNRLAEIMNSPSWRRGQSIGDAKILFPGEEEVDALNEKGPWLFLILEVCTKPLVGINDSTSRLHTHTNRTKDVTVKSEQDACIFIAKFVSHLIFFLC